VKRSCSEARRLPREAETAVEEDEAEEVVLDEVATLLEFPLSLDVHCRWRTLRTSS
jgi:hypothetical protein